MIASGFLALALYLGAAPVATSQAGLSKETRRTAKAPATAIDINRATVEDFSKLPGIGPKLARQIVAFRQKHGPFRRVEDLMMIKGIGVKKWKTLRSHVRVGNGPVKRDE